MPATEETKYNQKTMHVVFAAASVVMLVATIWMLAKDHMREWKDYQLSYREVNHWSTNARLKETDVLTREELSGAKAELEAAQLQPADEEAIARFMDLATAEDKRLAEEGTRLPPTDVKRIAQLASALAEAAKSPESKDAIVDARASLLGGLANVIAEAKRREDTLARDKKFATAEHTARVSELGIAIDAAKPQAFIDNLQAEIDGLADEIDEFTIQVDAANDYRTALEAIVKQDIRGEELASQKTVDTLQGELARLSEQLNEGALAAIGDSIARAPILDAFNNTEIGIEQVWLPDMKINYNFSEVARFDRCVTCHRGIDRTAAGSAVEPLYPTIPPDDRNITVALATPDESPATSADAGESEGGDEDADESADSDGDADADEDPETRALREGYGLILASRGQVNEDDVTVQVVLPGSAAADAGIATGDVITKIAKNAIDKPGDVVHYLVDNIGDDAWGQPINVSIRRGLDHPYTSHPRLDLYVGSLSPHKKGEIGCTICHDGQGSATEFRWASHSPNDVKQADGWHDEHGWFDNHHWIFPMMPQRFLESNCLKCHHDVIELEPTERFPEPPAPKLVRGWKLIQEYGCYGCHEINGYDGPLTRVGPDLRLEPNFFAAAQEILRDGGLSEEERVWAETVVFHPEDDAQRRRLKVSIDADIALATSTESTDEARLTERTHKLAEVLKDVETPGKLRKAGPSLRFVRNKVEYDWLYAWIREPKNFRPSTTMPQFFGQSKNYDYVNGEEKAFAIQGLADEPVYMTDFEYTTRMEEIETRAITEYLLDASDDFENLPKAEGVTEEPSAERGKALFQSRGCLACHSHVDFPGIQSTQGPELSGLAPKLDTSIGREWLYSWLKDPVRYHVRTVMPNLYLDPIEEKDGTGKPTGKVTDPAADISAFLLSGSSDWKPENVPPRELSESQQRTLEELTLEELTLEWLRGSFSKRKAKRFLRDGIPEEMRNRIKEDEKLLIGLDEENREGRLLEYVGRRSISKYGCFGCHDIPGFEDAKPIGTGLMDWGRKDPSKLAFLQIGQFLATHGVDGKHGTDDDPHDHGGHGIEPRDAADADTGYFLQALNSHNRQGFIWQKMRMPRSYDYAQNRNQGYNERLRMPLFPIDANEREAIITFVLGLTNETPAAKYLYKPTGREHAIHEGKDVLRKYNCGGCHFLEMENWRFAFEPDFFEEPAEVEDFPFLTPHFTDQAIEASKKTDRRGLRHAQLHGMPLMNEETGTPVLYDEEDGPLEKEDLEDDPELEPYYRFTLWRDALLDGYVFTRGQAFLVPAKREGYGPKDGTVAPSWGGDLTKYLFPHVIAAEKEINPQVQAGEAWGWLPPALIGEGRKVQTDWLHNFLLDPYSIRPAVVMRMPKFNMSPAEASKLVNYFAAVDNADFPYEYDARRRDGHLVAAESKHPAHFDDALKIVVNQNYCVKCHYIGDFEPLGAATGLGPNLDVTYRRLRADFVRRWIANPQRILPYTGMPVNIPYKDEAPHFGGVDQALYPGTSTEQLDALVDLLMNFDVYSKRQTEIDSLVKAAMPPPGAEAAEPAEADESSDGTE